MDDYGGAFCASTNALVVADREFRRRAKQNFWSKATPRNRRAASPTLKRDLK
jgi:hypothetical protein